MEQPARTLWAVIAVDASQDTQGATVKPTSMTANQTPAVMEASVRTR